MSLRILHISTRLILGGSQENTVLSCFGQSRLGHEVHLAFGPIYGPEGSHLDTVRAFNGRVRAGEEPGAAEVTLHELPNLVRAIHPVKDHFAYHHDLKRLVRRLRPDVVHTHSSKAGILGRAAAWAERDERGRPAIVHTIHGPPFMPIEGSALRRTKTRAVNGLYTLAERFAANRCHTIVSVADAMTDQFRARRIGTPGQFITVRSGMETRPFLEPRPGEDRASVRAGLGFDRGHFVIGTVARLAEHKGHDDILTALENDLRANAHWRLLWVGDGWWAERLLARARSMGLGDRIVRTGLVSNDRIPAMMRAMDVLCHPSYREGLPRTVPQALLAGVAVVATDVDGTREACLDPLVVAGVSEASATGRLVPPGDPESLGEAIRWMATHESERRAMGERGRAFCATEFAARTMVDRLEDVYAQAIRRAEAMG
ncbi:MAG: glycosyltransferase [Planctomycetota bacterium]